MVASRLPTPGSSNSESEESDTFVSVKAEGEDPLSPSHIRGRSEKMTIPERKAFVLRSPTPQMKTKMAKQVSDINAIFDTRPESDC